MVRVTRFPPHPDQPSVAARISTRRQAERQRRGVLEALASLALPAAPSPRSGPGGPGEGQSTGRRPRVIVVIPAHNEAASIGNTIRIAGCADDAARRGRGCLRQLHGRHGRWVSREAGADRVMTTVGNTARKAGALNQALGWLLPTLATDDLVLAMDADSQLSPDWIRSGVAALRRRLRRIGGVCGTYLGEPAAGLVCQLQRNEFVRASRLVPRRSSLWVLSGTGTMFRASVLREVARERGNRLPGRPGEYYDSSSITEDYEITLALKTLGFRCIVPPGCTGRDGAHADLAAFCTGSG